jgi:hypothetical protein
MQYGRSAVPLECQDTETDSIFGVSPYRSMTQALTHVVFSGTIGLLSSVLSSCLEQTLWEDNNLLLCLLGSAYKQKGMMRYACCMMKYFAG